MISAKKQIALGKRSFRGWEEEIADDTNNTNKFNGNPIPQCGAGLSTSAAVHAAIGRNFMRSTRQRTSTSTNSKKQICHFGHATTTSKQWLHNPAPSFWVGVPSSAVLCYRCYQKGYRGGLPPEQVAQDAPT